LTIAERALDTSNLDTVASEQSGDETSTKRRHRTKTRFHDDDLSEVDEPDECSPPAKRKVPVESTRMETNSKQVAKSKPFAGNSLILLPVNCSIIHSHYIWLKNPVCHY